MRDASDEGAAEQWPEEAATETAVSGPSPADKTTVVSVATLRRLAERSAEHPEGGSTPAPDPGVDTAPSTPPTFFAKSGAVLVIAGPERDAGSSRAEAPDMDPSRESGVASTRSEVRTKAASLPSALPSQAATRKNRASPRPWRARALTLALLTLLAVALVGKERGWTLEAARAQAARVPATARALVEFGRAFLSE